jgi:hypothetical protein
MSPLRSSILMFSLVTLVACGDDDTTGPTAVSVAGTYNATQADITYTGTTQPVDALALGASVVIVLTPQGTTSGTLVVPAVLTEEGIEDEVSDLTGTFTVSGNTVTFQGPGDNLFHDGLPWTIGNGTLTIVNSDAEGTIEVTLTRS